MAIVNSIQRIMAGYGAGAGKSAAVAPGGYATANATALTGSSAQTTAVALGTQGYTNGLVRVKIYNGGGTNTTAAVVISVTDGTNTYVVGSVPAITIANAANSGLDLVFDVNVDIQVATVNLVTTLAGTTTTASMDYEIDLNP